MELRILFDKRKRTEVQQALASGTLATVIRRKAAHPSPISEGSGRLLAQVVRDYHLSQSLFRSREVLYRRAGNAQEEEANDGNVPGKGRGEKE
jgi:hypothetical protein